MAWAGRHRAIATVLVVVLGVGIAIASIQEEPKRAQAVVGDTSSPARTSAARPPEPSPSPRPTSSPTPSPTSSPTPSATAEATSEPVASAGPRGDQAPVIIQGRVADVVDGDTIDLANGTRIRLAIVDTPEVHGGMEPCGPEASDFTARFVAGQTVAVYRPAGAPQTDSYGRTLGEVVRVSDGASLNVALVRAGLGTIDDRFTHEDPDLADRLAAAAAAADSPSCAPQAQPIPVGGAHTARTDGGWSCHPAYQECLPQVGDLDCGDVGHQVSLLGDDDPYRLDGRSTSRDDGLGCESYGPWSPAVTYPYY
jgi:endonuclease YncB( thermonuclease family)